MGFPTLKKLTEAFKDNDSVVFLAVQTVFEGHGFNTKDKLRSNQIKYTLKVPMAHDAGNPQSDPIPMTMKKYRSGGTPWTVIIDPAGNVVYDQFHIPVDQAVTMINDFL